MGTGCEKDRKTVRSSVDARGRVTIKQEDRIALGLDDMEEGDRALLEMEVSVLKEDLSDSNA